MIILGDSLSAGYGLSESDAWVSLIQDQWQQEQPSFELINASISGETTEGGLRRLPSLLEQHQPDWVFIELGGNDGLRGFQISEVRANLSEMIQISKNNNVNVALSAVAIPPNFGPRYTQMFEQIYVQVAQEHNVELVPFFMLEIATRPEWMQNDGIHPNLSAQPKIARIMEPQLRALLERSN
ncbi:arylesterase [Aliidiomarina sp. B3213]|nr:arylesterase [Aliidiomarina sp. B3213]